MQISDTEFGSINVDWEVNFAASTKILDITVAAMFWSSRYGASSLATDLGLGLVICGSSMAIVRQWRQRDLSIEFVSCD